MLKTVAVWASIVAITGSLAGCDFTTAFLFTSEDKINAAFPLSEAARNGKTALIDSMTGAQRKEIEDQFDTRLKLRALNCAKGYSPSWYTSSEEIRKKLDGQSCFIEADNEIARWLGLRRVGQVLAKPALKPVPTSAPSFIVADGFIQTARFATRAGIALLETQQAIEVVDFENTKPLFRETKRSTAIGFPSPNGRLFTTGEGERLKIRDTESGAVIAEIPSVRAYEFHWLDERSALYNQSDSGKAFLIDFISGKEAPVQIISGGVQGIVRVPGSENQYVIFSNRGVAKIELVRTKVEPEIKLIAEKQISGISLGSNTSDVSADGTHYFCFSANHQLTIVSLDSLEIETISFDPFRLQTATISPDPDKIILTGFVQPPQGERSPDLLYSISNRTIMPIDRSKLISQRYIYIRSLQKQAAITDNKITLMDGIPTLETIPLSKFTADMLEASNQYKLEAFERQQAQQASMAGYAPGYRPNSSFMPAPAAPPVIEPFTSGHIGGGNGPIANLARDAQVEAVGVYKGENRTIDGRKMGNVEVRIRRSTKPVVLVLSSYEPVRWMLIPEPGARLAAVLVSGNHPSQVVGAGSARVIMIGLFFAYKLGSQEYNALNQEIVRWTGKGIGVFQGSYEAATFSVGG